MWRCKDVRTWRFEYVKMWGCGDEKMWRWEDVKMWWWEDVMMCTIIIIIIITIIIIINRHLQPWPRTNNKQCNWINYCRRKQPNRRKLQRKPLRSVHQPTLPRMQHNVNLNQGWQTMFSMKGISSLLQIWKQRDCKPYPRQEWKNIDWSGALRLQQNVQQEVLRDLIDPTEEERAWSWLQRHP